MTTISAGATGAYTFTSKSVVAVTLAPAEHAIVEVVDASVKLYGDRLSASRTIGPFPAGAVLTIIADGPAVDYEVTQHTSSGAFMSYTGQEGVGYSANSTTGLNELDPNSRNAMQAERGTRSLKQYMQTSNDYFQAMRLAIADLVDYWSTRNGRGYVIEIPPMDDVEYDGLGTISIPPGAKFSRLGQVTMDLTGITVPAHWVRADLPGYMPADQYSLAASNIGDMFSGAPMITKDTTKTAGSCLFRLGSGDGVMGDLYVGGEEIYTILFGLGNFHCTGFAQPIEFTNYQVFSIHLHGFRIDQALRPIVTSTAAGYDFGELHKIDDFFISNTVEDVYTLNAAHEFMIGKGSTTFTKGDVAKINANGARLTFNGHRIERFDRISASSGSFGNGRVSVVGGTKVLPSQDVAGVARSAHMRQFHTGTHQVHYGDWELLMGSANVPFDATYAAAANMMMGDSSVVITPGSVSISQSTSSTLKASPIYNRNSLVPNYNFADGTIDGWHKNSGGTIAYEGAAGNESNGCLQIVVSAAQAIANSPRIRAEGGRKYAANCAIRVLASGSPTASFIVGLTIHWYGAGKQRTLSGSTPLAVTNTSTTVTVGSDANHGHRVGDVVQIGGSGDVGGIVAANINGPRVVTAVNSTVSWAFEAGAAATSTTTGGGASVTVIPPVTFISSTTTQSQTVADAIKDVWLHQGGTQDVVAPGAAIAAAIQINTGSSHTGTLQADDFMLNAI